jgi:hypothetical protein
MMTKRPKTIRCGEPGDPASVAIVASVGRVAVFGTLGAIARATVVNEQPNMIVGVAWYRREEYALLRALASDAESMAATYEEWLAGATKLVADLQRQGVNAHRVDVEVRELAAWCERQGRPLDGAARSEFATQKIT